MVCQRLQGVIEDKDNTNALASLLRFSSSKSGDEKISLDKYIKGKKEGQKAIYYMAADNKTAAASAPFVEDLTNRGYEVSSKTAPLVAPNSVGCFGLGVTSGQFVFRFST